MPDTSCSSPLCMPRESGKFIAERSTNVIIDENGIKKTASVLVEKVMNGKFSIGGWKKEKLHPSVTNEAAIDFIFVMDTLNFSFWPDGNDEKFTIMYEKVSYTGYWALVAALKRAQDEGFAITDAKFMSCVDQNTFSHIFRSSTESNIPLLRERVEALNDAGSVLLNNFNGTFLNCLKSCEKDAIALIRTIVSNFKSFRDESQYEGQKVSFYKRAQILVADIWDCFQGKGLGEFYNIDELTMFADYRVPQTLEYFGILCYTSELKKILRNQTVLESGSRYELEIRGCSIEAVERLKTELRRQILEVSNGEREKNTKQNTMVNSITVDFYLWDYAKSHRKQMAHLPFHKVRTIYY
ncbi:queuosine 5'-phosphate N-glycosylase/hydrolase-like [Clavelina lepadiformis]|uniref:queuosine 5'-phosphate N-glycosylase/hydrolase-like n=1 Tax=Clavelina lepadiformis TaxID=159417 RepID=UPI00404275C1